MLYVADKVRNEKILSVIMSDSYKVKMGRYMGND